LKFAKENNKNHNNWAAESSSSAANLLRKVDSQMLIIQCTKKLGDYLKKNLKQAKRTQDLFYAWHAHLFLIKRKKYIMLMNSQTRYVFVIGPVMAKDIKNLDEMIYAGIQENLEADGINSSFIEQYMQHLDGIEYMKTSERPIIGQ